MALHRHRKAVGSIPVRGKGLVLDDFFSSVLGDLKTRKSTGTSCRIEINFSSKTRKFFIKCNLLRFQISDGLITFFTEHDYKVSTSFIKENKRYK